MNIKNIKPNSKIIIIGLVFVFMVSFLGYLFYSKQQKEKNMAYISEVKTYDKDLDMIMSNYMKNELKGLDSIGNYSDEQMKFMLTFMRGNVSVAVNDKYKTIFKGQADTRNTQTKFLDELTPPDKFKDTHNEILSVIKDINSNWNDFNRHLDIGDFKIIEADVNNLNNNANKLNEIYQKFIADIEYEIEFTESKLR